MQKTLSSALIERSLSHYGSSCSARCQPQTHTVCTTAHSRGHAARGASFRLQYRALLVPARLANIYAERRRRQNMHLQFRSAKHLCHVSTANIFPTTVGRFAGNCVGNGVLQATVGATFKLLLACGLVGWLLHSGRLSEDTAPVLSKVAFNVMLPCMLFTKVGSTLANSFHWSLFAIPVVALLQLAVGALGGEVCSRLLDPSSRRKLGWHPMNPARSAKAIAMSTAAASGIPLAAPALLPTPANAAPAGTRELIAACCTFGNSFTLPLVFMMSLLPGGAFDRATGYTALFLVGWSPLLWTYGYRLFGAAASPTSADQQGPLHSFDEADINTAQMALLATPGDEGNDAESAALRTRLALRRRLSAVKRTLEKIFNPPLIGIVTGIVVGASPLGRHLFSPASPNLPMELGLCFVEMLALLAGGSLAVQTIVLGSSLFQRVPAGMDEEGVPAAAPAIAFPEGLGAEWRQDRSLPAGRDANLQDQDWKKGRTAEQLDMPPKPRVPPQATKQAGQNLLSLLLPHSRLEWKMMAAISAVRFGLVPAATLLVVHVAVGSGVLPPDPVCYLALLIQAAMPPAQNLAVVVNLRSSTRFLAPRLAKLLLRLYVAAALPVTLWITVFVSRLPVPLTSL